LVSQFLEMDPPIEIDARSQENPSTVAENDNSDNAGFERLN